MKFVVYGTEQCPYCVRAKNELERNEYEYIFVNVKEDEEARNMFNTNGWRTVPQIVSIEEDFTGQTESYVGGYTELVQYLANG